MNRVFLLSPAKLSGERARWILKPDSELDLARRLRASDGVPLGEVFSFLSALYFRGKLAYATAFARPPGGSPGVMIITPSAGLVPHDTPVRISRLRGFARVPINTKHVRYRRPLARDLRRLAAATGPDCEIVLLGSIASGKYLDIVARVIGERLRVPADFVGMGDMQRGALLLRRVRENRELDYVPIGALSSLPPRARKVLAARAQQDRLRPPDG
ncbi:MAG TPA: hypothetical protein VNL14_06955 [Candidatus Acidoferrales bacterium]|nr:hypothetical protein [Candidatus Acidoferrales bacterium]